MFCYVVNQYRKISGIFSKILNRSASLYGWQFLLTNLFISLIEPFTLSKHLLTGNICSLVSKMNLHHRETCENMLALCNHFQNGMLLLFKIHLTWYRVLESPWSLLNVSLLTLRGVFRSLSSTKALYIFDGCCTEFNVYYFILYLF